MAITQNKYPEVKKVIDFLIKNHRSTKTIIQEFGTEDTSIKRESRGSLFLKPNSNIFGNIAINPDLGENQDSVIKFFSISFCNCEIEIKDLIELDNNYQISYIHYDDLYFLSVSNKDLNPISKIEVLLDTNKDIEKLKTSQLRFRF